MQVNAESSYTAGASIAVRVPASRAGHGLQVEVLLWDGSDPLAWLTPGSDPNQVLVHGASQEVRALGTKTGGGTVQRQLHPDNQATTEALTDATQTVVDQRAIHRTGAWGNVISGSAVDSPLVYHGGLGYWADADLGLYYVRARWLDPTTGRWLSVDPVESEPRYGYVGNQPTTKVDPSGEQSLLGMGAEWVAERYEEARTFVEGARLVGPALVEHAEALGTTWLASSYPSRAGQR